MSARVRVGLDDSGGRTKSHGGGDRHQSSGIDRAREARASIVSRPRMSRARLASALIVCVAAIVIVSAMALASVGKGSATLPKTSRSAEDAQPAPGTPFLVFGIVYDSLGNPVAGATVVITNENTTEFVTLTSEFDGYFESDMQASTTTGCVPNNTMNVTATYGTQIGWINATIPDPAGPYLSMDVTIYESSVIPEFPMVVMPIVGIMVLFTAASLRRRRDRGP